MMNRRAFISAASLGFIATPLAAETQSAEGSEKVPRVGVLAVILENISGLEEGILPQKVNQ